MTDRNIGEPMLIAPDPAGVAYALSGGRIRDPIGNAVRRSLAEASRLDKEAAGAQTERIVTNQEATESRETGDSDQDEEMVERQTGEHVQTVL